MKTEEMRIEEDEEAQNPISLKMMHSNHDFDMPTRKHTAKFGLPETQERQDSLETKNSKGSKTSQFAVLADFGDQMKLIWSNG